MEGDHSNLACMTETDPKNLEETEKPAQNGATTVGTHILVDFWGCLPELLNNSEAFMKNVRQAVEDAETAVLNDKWHGLEPNGFVGVLLITEGHISIHTHPDTRYAAVDIYALSREASVKTIEILKDTLRPLKVKETLITRGIPERQNK